MVFHYPGVVARPCPPAGATEIRVDTLLRCETNAVCEADQGIRTLPPVQPWGSVLSFHAAAPLAASELGKLRAEAGVAAVVAVTAVELLCAHGDDPLPVKTLGVLRKRSEDSSQEFAEHWRRTHAQVTLDYRPTFRRYVTNTVDAVSGEFPWDGVVEQYFASLDELAEHVRLARTGERPEITADIPRFVSRMLIFAAAPEPATVTV